jgi:DNA primase
VGGESLVTQEELYEIFSLMGTRLSGSGTNQKTSCPLAPWTHSSGKDSHPSMSVRNMGEGTVVFNCFTCHEKGQVKNLAWKYGDLSKDYAAYEYVRRLYDRSDYDPWAQVAKQPYGQYFKKVAWMSQQHDKKNPQNVTEESLKEWLKQVPQYALERGLTQKEILEYEIGYDAKERRMIIPIRDHKKELMGVSGRDVTGKQKPKYKHYQGFKKEKVFYGEQWLDPKVSAVNLVEGFMDVWRLRRFGKKNVFASMGTSLSTEQIRKIMNWRIVNITIFPDCDAAGMQFAEQMAEKLVRHGMVVGIAGVIENKEFIHQERSRLWRPTDFRLKPLEELKGKDPGDYTQKELETATTQTRYLVLKNNKFTVE